MALAGNVSLVTVTGTYVDFEGSPIAGQVIFRVPKTLRNMLADQILVPSALYATLDANGQFSVTLPATDDPDFHETFTYTVTESFAGGRTFTITLPEPLTYAELAEETYGFYATSTYEDVIGISADMADLAPAGVSGEFVGMASQANYVDLEGRVTAAEAAVDTTPPTTGIILTLEYDSVPVGYATYTALAGGLASYTAFATSPVLASTAAILALASTAQASVTAAQASQALAEAAEVRDPHPFVFTGAA